MVGREGEGWTRWAGSMDGPRSREFAQRRLMLSVLGMVGAAREEAVYQDITEPIRRRRRSLGRGGALLKQNKDRNEQLLPKGHPDAYATPPVSVWRCAGTGLLGAVSVGIPNPPEMFSHFGPAPAHGFTRPDGRRRRGAARGGRRAAPRARCSATRPAAGPGRCPGRTFCTYFISYFSHGITCKTYVAKVHSTSRDFIA